MDDLPSFHLTQPSAPEEKRWEVQYDMLHTDFPRLQPYTLSGGCALGRVNTCLRRDGGPVQALHHPTGSHSAPMIPYGLINEE